MKWFKHDTDCDKSEGLSILLELQGFSGYGRWFRLLEIIASKMDKTERCHVEYSAKKWCSLLQLKQKKLKTFLELTENKLKTKVVYSENIIRIEIPNLLNKRDEYSRKSGHTPDNVAQDKDKDKDKEEDKDKEVKTIKKPRHKKPSLTDDEWLLSIKSNPAYEGIDVEKERGKCIAWFQNKGIEVSRQRLLNWLNRAEKPLKGGNNGRTLGHTGKDHEEATSGSNKYSGLGTTIEV